MDIGKIHGATTALLQLATFLLIAIAVGSILVFFKVFKSDFSELD